MGTRVGDAHAVSAWLRSGTRQTLRAVLRARSSLDDPLEQTSTPMVLGADWQEVTVLHTVEDPAAAVVEVYFSVESPAPGACFQLDDVCFRALP